jgi:hypothetical protein
MMLHLKCFALLGQGSSGERGVVGEQGALGNGDTDAVGGMEDRGTMDSIPLCSDPILWEAGGLGRRAVSRRSAHAGCSGTRMIVSINGFVVHIHNA